ncbi:MAG: zinc-binding alcohol dehydrogenase family protein [Gordonia sp. (in: high G+C Gram-positive bacteria)]|uniref:zinc-binding alcohol dehydrogenase family protein n=1 Tax=Gordonia sp. (in: high G+C Gram-positive bacteria) TaxID=84139 RepID=UPI0039E2A142
MKAAVVTAFGSAPRYTDAPDPAAHGDYEVVVDVLAAALSPRVRSQAAGSHYTSTGDLPLIPGIDGVGRLPDGGLVYFLLPDTTDGAMAERTVIDRRRSVPLPDDADPAVVAAAMNPAMASWVALTQRTDFQAGQNVLILGATGSAGRAAVQVANRLGAGDIVAVGRGTDRMADLTGHGATRLIELDADPDTVAAHLAEAGAEVDVVLDFLWGEPTARALYAVVPHRTRDEQLLTWIQIGSVAGPESPIPSAALRAVNLRIIGSGQGSVEPRAYRAEIGALADEIDRGTFDVAVRRVPLRDVEAAWSDDGTTERIVFIP